MAAHRMGSEQRPLEGQRAIDVCQMEHLRQRLARILLPKCLLRKPEQKPGHCLTAHQRAKAPALARWMLQHQMEMG